MFKKHKLEVRIVKNESAKTTAAPEEPTLTAEDYVNITIDGVARLGKKLIIGAVVTVAAVALVTVLANAADTALQNAIASE